jgi:cyclopropane-fatty-acyl-phospholipid synthase
MSVISRFVDDILPVGSVTVLFPGGKRQTYGGGGGRHLTLRFHDKNVVREIWRNPRLRFAELYMDGRVTIEDGTIADLLQLIIGARTWEEARPRKGLGKGKAVWLKRFFRRNDPGRSRKNVAHHYDIGNSLYELFLDEDWQYSCAYYTDPENRLEQAQRDKLAHIAAKLHLKPGQRVLDIGCGWGGMAIYLHQVADVDVLGVTLSEEQLTLARQRAKQAGVSDRVKFELMDYRQVEGPFDRIVSVGMFEHVGAAHYELFFRKCRDLLAEDGVMLLHTIGKLGGAGMPDPFIDKWIFPGYHVPALSQMCTATETVRLIVSDVETLRLHYAYTLREWLRRCYEHRAEIERRYDARFFRMWEFYLAGSAMMFETGAACNFQVQYVRNRHALPLTRDYMAQAEARYRALQG